MIRKNRLTLHYREMFGEPGSRLDPSSSAPSSSSALGSSGPETVPETQNLRRQNPIPGESSSDTHPEADVERRSDEFYRAMNDS
ncbi:hypothetical protein Bca4012_005978 [Brassica carinata]